MRRVPKRISARSLLRQPGTLFGLSVITVIVMLAVFGPWLTPSDPNRQNIPRRLEGPSWDYWLGTDHLGRDLLSRLIAGTRVGLAMALPTVAAALVIGLAIGLASGYAGGRVDAIGLLIVDFLGAFPGLILALVLIPLLGTSIPTLVFVLMIAFMPPYARVTRASVLAVKERQFVLAERALGASAWRITLAHVLPNVVAPVLILAAIDIPVVIVAESGLSFLGLGVPPPDASWGSILFEGFSRVRDSPGPVAWPAIAIAVTTVAFTLVGESLKSVTEIDVAGARTGRSV